MYLVVQSERIIEDSSGDLASRSREKAFYVFLAPLAEAQVCLAYPARAGGAGDSGPLSRAACEVFLRETQMALETVGAS